MALERKFPQRERNHVYDEETRFVILICLRHWPGVMPTTALKVRLKEGWSENPAC